MIRGVASAQYLIMHRVTSRALPTQVGIVVAKSNRTPW